MVGATLLLAVLLVFVPDVSHAWMSYNLDEPISGLRDNSAVDIIYDGTYIWFATSKGLSGTSDRGQTWITYDVSNGLNASEISAIAYANGRLWVASAHSPVINGQLIPWGDGFNTTTDNGASWDSSQPAQAAFPNMLAYDIAVLDSAVWAPCFAGGLIRSLDYGQTWSNIYADSADSADMVDLIFSRRTNLYYSVVVDTFPCDSVVVWAGCAAGIHKYIYIDETVKLAGMRTFDLSYNDKDSSIWLAVDGGLSRGVSNDEGLTFQFRSWDNNQGMLSDFYTAVEADSDFVVAAAWDAEGDSALGFNYSINSGSDWLASQPEQAVGEGKFVSRIKNVDGTMFAACSEGGLIRSTDFGESWQSIYPIEGDTSPEKPYNRFYSLFAEPLGDDSVELWAGCDTGLFVFTFENPAGAPVDIRHIPLVDTDSNGQHVEAIFVWDLDTTLIWDSDTVSQEVWIATHAVDPASGDDRVLLSINSGETWTRPLTTATAFDIGVGHGRLWIPTSDGILYSKDFGVSFESILGKQGMGIDSAFTRIETADRTIWVASREVAIRTMNTVQWMAERVNTDPLKFDVHSLYDTLDDLSGDFVTALGLQYYDGKKTIWAATQKTETGENGVTSTNNDGNDWIVRETGVQIWNFAFDKNDVYFASNQGLFRMLEGEENFTRLSIKESARRKISDNAEFYSVRPVGDDLWVGSSDGIAVVPISELTGTIFREFYNVKTQEGGKPYASPVPVSPSKGLGFVRLHYYLPTSDNVTIKVYDFAMNLVKTVIDNEPRAPRETSDQEDDDTWNLRNDNGDIVAAGVYFFVIETSSGHKDWGKIMVLP